MVARNKTIKPEMKIKSATFSNRSLLFSSFFIEIKDNIQLVINITTAAIANSSIKESLARFSFFNDVRTIKQIPKRFAEVDSI